MILMLVSFLVALATLIVIHEFGHYQVAKWCGVKVLRFSIGFGKPLISKSLGKDRTEFVLASIPMGGYVKMLDERELEADERDTYAAEMHRAFNRQSVYKRMAIVAAGPVANLLLAILLYWLLIAQGVTGFIANLEQPVADTPAAISGFKQGQIVTSVAGSRVQSWQDLHWILLQQLPSQRPIPIQVKNPQGDVQLMQLDASKINADDLDENMMLRLGFVLSQPEIPAVIGQIQANTPAAKAGLKTNDKILRLNGEPIKSWQQLVVKIRKMPGQNIHLEYQRDSKIASVDVLLDTANESHVAVGKLGVGPAQPASALEKMLITQHYSPSAAMGLAIQKTWQTSVFSLKMLFKMITGQASLKTISGPVTIANYAGQSAHLGWKPYIAFLAILSISLGVLNLLPIPILDGGHIMYYTAEIIRGRPLSESWMVVGQKVGFVMLGTLMLLALYNDLNRLMTGSF